MNYRATATALQQQNQECFPTTNTPAHLQLSSLVYVYNKRINTQLQSMSNIESTLTERAKYCCLQSLAEGNVAKYLLRVELSSKTFTMRVQQNIYIESLFSQAQIKLNLKIDCRHSAHSRFTKLIHHLSFHQSGQGAARHGMQRNIAHKYFHCFTCMI